MLQYLNLLFSLVVLLKTLFLLKLSFALKLLFQSCDIVLKFPVNILSEGKLPCSLTRDCGVKDSGVGGCFFFFVSGHHFVPQINVLFLIIFGRFFESNS